MNEAICKIIILTYKGKFHLEFLLPTVKKAISSYPQYPMDVLIVDNGNDISTKDYVNNNFPDFSYEFSPYNDYLFSLNPFIKKCTSPFAFILNDDMRLHANVLKHGLDTLVEDDSLFSVTCNVMDWEGSKVTTGIRFISFKNGWFSLNDNLAFDNLRYYTLFAGGGAAMFRTQMFNSLNGFDTLYRPAYCEDGDISYRAWHRGWKIIFDPEAILFHREGATIKDQYKYNRLARMQTVNKITMIVRNSDYQYFLTKFLLSLPFRLLLGWRVDKNYWLALWKALPKISMALFKRTRRSKHVLTDEQIMEMLGKPYTIPNIK
jgi:GT2 family glycosyltransferase